MGLLGLACDVYVVLLTPQDILSHVVNAFVLNGNRYNMLNSTIIEIFHLIQKVRGLQAMRAI